MIFSQPKLWAALERLNTLARRIDHEAEIDHVVAQAESDHSLESRHGIVAALPAGSVSNLLGVYDTVTVGKRIGGKDKTLGRYEVVARIGDGSGETIVAICS